MGVSTDGQICYGIMIDEDVELPWYVDHDGDAEQWWLDLNGYKPPFELFDDDGNFLPGKNDSHCGEYFAHKREWMKNNPLPFEEVNYCSGDYPMWVLAVPSTVKTALRGAPVCFDPLKLSFDKSMADALVSFCEANGIEGNSPRWLLTSYWG